MRTDQVFSFCQPAGSRDQDVHGLVTASFFGPPLSLFAR
jgi:hypothetical protein